MWKDKFQEIIQEKKIYGEKVNIGVTEEELENYFKEAKAELNVDLPNDYANILKLVNGLEFNGLSYMELIRVCLANNQIKVSMG